MHAKFATCLAGVVIAGLVATAVAAAEPCARTAEKAAFDVAGLKSELMVTAIACQAQERYNSFVTRFRGDLQSQERSLNSYFNRTAGRHASQQHDDYITSLANAQSQEGISRGTFFCQEHLSMFDDVLALKDGHDLLHYATAKTLAQPIDLTECPAPPPPAAKKPRTKTAQK
jgi:hypothetical protein